MHHEEGQQPPLSKSQEIKGYKVHAAPSSYQIFQDEWEKKETALINKITESVIDGINTNINSKISPLNQKIKVYGSVAVLGLIVGVLAVVITLGSYNISRDIQQVKEMRLRQISSINK